MCFLTQNEGFASLGLYLPPIKIALKVVKRIPCRRHSSIGQADKKCVSNHHPFPLNRLVAIKEDEAFTP